MEDGKIVELYWARDEEAIPASQEAYGAYCRAIAWRILKVEEDCEECLSDTWLKAWLSMPPQRPDILSAFFGCITRNLAFSRWREKRALKRAGDETVLALSELSECVSGRDDPVSEIEGKELEAAINRFLRSIRSQECDIFLLRYYHVYSISAIALRFSMKENTVKSILLRTRRRLRRFLEEEGYSV
ncbi:MAG: sigma-70 family RNA polymerase sigma factor [Oscillospiraceae bacterium]|nr:sigma-70 family RNA polymerase sigma factor [Oscillospiraceae bacterium]